MSLERNYFGNQNATESSLQNFDLSLIFERLKQIRTYISQANQMMLSMSSENNEKSERYRKIRQLVNELQEQENSYVQLMNRYLNIDGKSNSCINGFTTHLQENYVEDKDEEEENDDTSIDLEDNQSNDSQDSPTVITPRRPLIEDHLGDYPFNFSTPATPAYEDHTERGAAAPFHMDSDDSNLQAALSAQLAILKQKNSELLVATSSLNNISANNSDSYVTDLRNQRNNLHQSLEEYQKRFTRDEEISIQSSAKRFARQWSGCQVSPSKDFILRNVTTSSGGPVQTDLSQSVVPYEEGRSINDDVEECSSRTSEVTDNALMATAIPQELLALRRQLDQLQYQQEREPNALKDDQVLPSGDHAGSSSLLRFSEEDLIQRLTTLQNNRTEIYQLLKEIDALKTQTDEEEGGGSSSIGSSQLQIANTLNQLASANQTEDEARRVVGNIEAQNKLLKLEEVRNRLNTLKDMMTFHQNATANVQSPAKTAQKQEESSVTANVKELTDLLTTLRSGAPLTSLTRGQLDLLSTVMADESCVDSLSDNQSTDIESSQENLVNGIASQSRVVDSDYYRGGRGVICSDQEIAVLQLERDRLAEMCGAMDEKLAQLSNRNNPNSDYRSQYVDGSGISSRWMAPYSNGLENEEFVDIHAENLKPHEDFALYDEDDADSGGDMQQVEEEEEEADPRAGSPIFSYSNRYSPRVNTNNCNTSTDKHRHNNSKSIDRQTINNSYQFPVGLEARARALYSEPVTTNNNFPAQSKRTPPLSCAQQHANSFPAGAAPLGYAGISGGVTPAYPPALLPGSMEMWNAQYLQEQSVRLMSEMCQLQYSIQSVVSQMYSQPSQLVTPPSHFENQLTQNAVYNHSHSQQNAAASHHAMINNSQPQDRLFYHPDNDIPPLNLKSPAHNQSLVSRYFGAGSKRESAAKLASKKQKLHKQQKESSSPYRPGVSARISGTAFESDSEFGSDDLSDEYEEGAMLFPTHHNKMQSTNRSSTFNSSVTNNRHDVPVERNNNHMMKKEEYDQESVHRLVERGIELLADSDEEESKNRINNKLSPGRFSTVATISSQPSSLSSPYNQKGVSRLQRKAGKSGGGSDCSQFDALRETIYAEVATLISQNESSPHFLIELFRELQHLSSDYLRQRVLYVIHDLVTKSLTKQVLNLSAQNSNNLSSLSDQDNSQDEEETRDYAKFSLNKDSPANRFTSHLSRYEAFKSPPNRNRKVLKAGPPPPHRRECEGFLDADYVENAPSTSSLSTPNLSPKRSTNNDKFSTNLDKVLQAFQDKARKKQRLSERKDDRLEVMSDSSLSEPMTSIVNTQELEAQIKEILQYLIPLLKEQQTSSITSQLIIWTRDVTISRVAKIINSASLSLMNHEALSSAAARYDQSADGITLEDIALEGGRPDAEFMRFFYKQLSVQLYESLVKFEGKKLLDCIEDLMVDISEILFNELAFFRLIVDLDAGKSGLTTETECSETEENNYNDPRGEESDDDEEEEEEEREEVDHNNSKAETNDVMTGDENIETASDGNDEASISEDEENSYDEFDDIHEIPDTPKRQFLPSAGRELLFKSEHQHFDSSSLSFSLAPSETKPMTQIGSDEDEDDEYMVENSDGDDADTAVAHSSLLQHMVDMASADEPLSSSERHDAKCSPEDAEIFIDAEEKDAISGSCGEKREQKHNSEPVEDDIIDQDQEEEVTVENFPADGLSLNRLVEELQDMEECSQSNDTAVPEQTVEAIISSLSNCPELAGNENELPPPDDVVNDCDSSK